jgi:hypothetical protein
MMQVISSPKMFREAFQPGAFVVMLFCEMPRNPMETDSSKGFRIKGHYTYL